MTVPPWEEARDRLRGKRGQTRHAASEVAGAGNSGTMQVNSGRHWFSKRDFKRFSFLFENRQTDSNSITVNGKELQRMTREAIFEQSFPAMRLDFTKLHEDWTLIRSRDFTDINDRLVQLEGLLDEQQRQRDVETES